MVSVLRNFCRIVEERGEETREPMGGKDNTTSLVTSRQAFPPPDALYNAILAPSPAPENRIPSGWQQRSHRLFIQRESRESFFVNLYESFVVCLILLRFSQLKFTDSNYKSSETRYWTIVSSFRHRQKNQNFLTDKVIKVSALSTSIHGRFITTHNITTLPERGSFGTNPNKICDVTI
jgi:hypothetical protein